MLTERENERLTRVGPGTPMGELLRRYWHPVAGSAEVTDRQPRPVRLLGEDLVLFRDRRGRLGLVADRCPHRGAQLRYGIPEDEGLRCPYHGRVWSSTGACVESPADPPGAAPSKLRVQAYAVEELGGLVFAYLGPPPVPLLPRWELLVRDGFLKQIGTMRVPCNWLQVAENALDLAHLYWLHGYYALRELDRLGVPEDDPRRDLARFFAGFKDYEYDFVRYEHGIMRTYTKPGDEGATREQPVIFPNLAVISALGEFTMNYRVPVDDVHTLYVSYMCFNPGGVEIPVQPHVPCFDVPLTGVAGELATDFQNGQDAMVWVTQGEIADRCHEALGREDKGVMLFRRMLQEQLASVEAGRDPMNVFRDPTANTCLTIPLEQRDASTITRTSYKPGAASGPYGPSHSPIQGQIDALFFRAMQTRQPPSMQENRR